MDRYIEQMIYLLLERINQLEPDVCVKDYIYAYNNCLDDVECILLDYLKTHTKGGDDI